MWNLCMAATWNVGEGNQRIYLFVSRDAMELSDGLSEAKHWKKFIAEDLSGFR